jgi:hypothetical protein
MFSNVQNKNVVYYFKVGYQYVLFYLFLMYHRIYKAVFKAKIQTVVDPLQEYFDKEKVRFLNTYDDGSSGSDARNINTSKEFYDMELYNETVSKENSPFEKKWKSNILYENTPRGNIGMYYDVYKKGFAYYSDQTSIPYFILNTLAMKYVRVFSCRDLFVDDEVTPDDNPSPLIELQKIDEKNEKQTKKEKLGNIGIEEDVLKKAPFAKLKKYKFEISDKNPMEWKKEKEEIKFVNNNRNKFIYMGKLLNFSFIQKIPVKSAVHFNIKNSMYSKIFEKEHELQTDVLSYKAFMNVVKQ